MTEWDKNGDCNPDAFYTADSGEEFAAAIRSAFDVALRNLGSGSAAAVVSNRNRDISGFYRSLYYPSKVFGSGANKKTITWAGRLHALFVDEAGRLREDNPTQGTRGRLDGLDIDKAIQLTTGDDGVVRIYEYDEGTGDYVLPDEPRTVDELDPVWEARDQLAALSNDNVPSNRASYTTSASQGRWIYTAIGAPIDGQSFSVASDADKFAFVAGRFDGADAEGALHQRYLHISPADGTEEAAAAATVAAGNLVDYIRGKEIEGNEWRKRTANFTGDDGNEVWRLGDIIHSAPDVVGPPRAVYYTSYGDTSYRDFMEKYAARRTVAYVGANDGMVHAFNGGFFVSSTEEDFRGFRLSLDGETEHPLGSELWAWVPNNLLPHLQWLKDPSYAHAYYVDGPAVTYDVNIFTTDTGQDCDPAVTTCHFGGWGTILVVTMGLGGGPIDVDVDGDGTPERRLSSAVLIFDVTNPEREPKLLAEIADPSDTGFGFTTSTPTLVFKRTPGEGTSGWNTPAVNQWYLVFGSGPDLDELKDYTTDRTEASLFVIDLNGIGAATPDFGTALTVVDTAEERSIISSPLAVDWDLNYETNAVYFGTVAPNYDSDTSTWLNAHTYPSGALKRMSINSADRETDLAPASWYTALSSVVTPDKPFGNRPTAAYDAKGSWWLYAGTGRLYTQEDVTSTERQTFYGIKEYASAGTAALTGAEGPNRLLDVTEVVVDRGGNVTGSLDGNAIAGGYTFGELEERIADANRGWYIDVDLGGISNATRVLSQAVFNDGFVLFSDYTPEGSEACSVTGVGRLWEVYGRTGTGHPDFSVDSHVNPNRPGDPEIVDVIRAERPGQIFEVGVIETPVDDGGSDTPNKGLFGEDTGGVGEIDLSGVQQLGGRMSWREIPMDQVQ
ncbi:MAG: hypothetical protein AMJ69_11255 [Gammaproteobacteria bacterium SG8_47]|nr:MAG: hypothetical protein AMJ69_11255 [Gammaproteobacteria bacterium SG8_47]